MMMFLYMLGYIAVFVLVFSVAIRTARKYEASWALFGMGAATFIASQVLHIPFNSLFLSQVKLYPEDPTDFGQIFVYALFLGISAGLFEEVLRYLSLRYWAKRARDWGTGTMFGAGYGGIEGLLLVVMGAINVVTLSLISQGLLAHIIPAGQEAVVEAQIAAVFDAPWYMALLPGIERVFAFCMQLVMTHLVIRALQQEKLQWLGASFLWHALIDTVAVLTVMLWGAVVAEISLGVLALLSLGILYWIRNQESTIQ